MNLESTKMRIVQFIFILSILTISFNISYGQNNNTNDANSYHLFTAENKIWRINLVTYSYEEFLSPTISGDEQLGDVVLSQDTGNIYYLIIKPSAINALYRYDIASGKSEMIIERDNLSRITSPSVTEKYLLATTANFEQPEQYITCIIELQAEANCYSVDLFIDFNNFYWLSNNIFASVVSDTISIVEIGSNYDIGINTYDDQTLLGDTVLNYRENSLIAIKYILDEAYYPMLMSFDLDSYRFTSLPNFDISEDNEATINSLALSDESSYIAYNIGTTTKILNFISGENIFEFENLTQYSWLSDNQLLAVQVTDSQNHHLIMIDIPSGSISEIDTFSSEIYFVASISMNTLNT